MNLILKLSLAIIQIVDNPDYSYFLGCNLSPLLFSLFINSLGKELNSTNLGITLGSVTISGIFFADDLVIVGKTQQALDTLVRMTMTYFSNHRLDISETKSKVMTYDAMTGRSTFSCEATQSSISLDQVLAFKYLGVSVGCAPYSLFKSFNEQVKRKAKSYLASVLSLVKTGPDRAELAYALWTCCALPAVLYGTEVMPLTQGTISELEKCQSQVGKFILQLPRSSASVSASIDAGLKPVWSLIAEKVLLYACNTFRKSCSSWQRVAMDVNMSAGVKSPYTRNLMKWKAATNSSLLSSKLVKRSVARAAVISVLDDQREHSTTMFAMNPPEPHKHPWFKLKPWVTDSCSTRLLSGFRACNIGLGNRGPTKDGRFFKLCPLCSEIGDDNLNNEVRTSEKERHNINWFSHCSGSYAY